ncbi:MAG: diguanylate cyclase [Magnetococcales bacterium]|nr:diguanylate cyclase [Magnetococcales bacterium]
MTSIILFVGQFSETDDELRENYPVPQYEIFHASTPANALEILKNHAVDIMVTDFELAQMDGLELTRQAQAMQNALQVILLTGPRDRPSVMQVISHHIAVELEKPVHRDELRIYVERCREIKRIRDELRHKEDLLKSEVGNREQAEFEANRALATRIAITALLETSLERLAFPKQIEVILDIILNIPWFFGQRKGALFQLDESGTHLTLVGHKNLDGAVLGVCDRVEVGQCLCGQAAQTRRIVFSDRVGEAHVTRYEGMQPHGHYCVPLVNQNALLGVLCLYLAEGHRPAPDEEALLSTLSATLARILEHRKTEGELKQAEEQLRFMAYHDPLTGLHNRQFFDQTFNKLFMALQNPTRRHNEAPFQGACLAIFDIDHFKKVNDNHGHLIGDEVLVLFARKMTECFRERDATFRFGGEEFVVLLHDVTPEVAEVVLNRFRQSIASYPFPQVGQVTVSIGAVRVDAGELAASLIEKADKALYFAKSNGRNQVHFHHVLVAAGHVEDVERDTGEVDLW